jgi:hypothetical protein
MGIRLYQTPQRRDDALTIECSAQGETLTINGHAFDLSAVRTQVQIDCDLIAAPVFRQDGDVHVQVIVPYGPDDEPCAHDVMPEYVAPLSLDDYRAAIQATVDRTAQARLYDSGNSLASYANSTNPRWAAEAQAFIAWRDSVWAFAYDELARVEAGERPQPTVEQIVSELAPIRWPVTNL